MKSLDRQRWFRALPPGTVAVGTGLVVLGLTSYGFLVLSARALGPTRYAPLSALWALVFLAGPGAFLPIEQEVARFLASRDAGELGGRATLVRAGIAGAGLTVTLLVILASASALLLHRLFDRNGILLLSLALGLIGFFFEYLLRGLLSGHRLFRRYALVLGLDGGLRLAGCVGLVIVSSKAVGAYGLVIAIAPMIAFATGSWRQRRHILTPGSGPEWPELARALGFLLAASVLSQVLLNGGPIAVKALATTRERTRSGQFLAGLVLSRVPLFLFQGLQAALLPQLARLAGAQRFDDFRKGLDRLLVAVIALGGLATLAAFVVGPAGVRLLFGSGFALGRVDLGYLALGNALFLLAVALSQALIALSYHGATVTGWAVGVAVFIGILFGAHDLLFRVELALLGGSGFAAGTMALALASALRRSSQMVVLAAEDMAQIGHAMVEP